VYQLRAVLRSALNDALRWGLVARNVAALAEGPRITPEEIRPLSPDEAKALLDVISRDRLEALYAVALAIGLRQGEALGLHWGDVDLEAGTLRVRTSLQQVNGEWQFVEPKTSRSRRTIALPDVAVSRCALTRAARSSNAEALAPRGRMLSWCSPRRPVSRCGHQRHRRGSRSLR